VYSIEIAIGVYLAPGRHSSESWNPGLEMASPPAIPASLISLSLRERAGVRVGLPSFQ
jgi:hypothetical protein